MRQWRWVVALGWVLAGLVTAPALAQKLKDGAWQVGNYSLLDGREYDGLLRYDAATDLLQVKTMVGVRVYSARQVQQFRVLDAGGTMLREFAAIEYNPRTNYPRQAFFEVVVKGALHVLRRHDGVDRTDPDAARSRESAGAVDYQTGFDYFVYQPGHPNPLVALRRFRKQVLPAMMREFGSELGRCVRNKNLSVNLLADQVRLINQYNALATSR